MPQANLKNITPDELNITANEALFLRCVLQCQNDYGTKPPAKLGLPRAIGVVVDYDFVKRLMFTMMLREGRGRRFERAMSALQTAPTRLMAMGVVASSGPFIWWTGKPVRGIKETERNDPSLFEPPFPTFASKTRERKQREPVILRPVDHGFTADGRPVTRCIGRQRAR